MVAASPGRWYGYSSAHRWIPDYGIGVIVLCNQGNGNPAPAVASRALWLMTAELLGAVPPTQVLAPIREPVVALEPENLHLLEGTYRQPGGLVRFAQQDGDPVFVIGDERIALDAHSETEFSSQNRRYTFARTEAGAVRGIHFLSPNYASNAAEFWPLNDTPYDTPGPDRAEWAAGAGSYVGRHYGQDVVVTLSVKNGYLYLDGPLDLNWHGGLKLTEYEPRLLFTADGEAVQLADGRMMLGNRTFVKQAG